jgi:hypothetical protein
VLTRAGLRASLEVQGIDLLTIAGHMAFSATCVHRHFRRAVVFGIKKRRGPVRPARAFYNAKSQYPASLVNTSNAKRFSPIFPDHPNISKSTEGASPAHRHGMVYLKFVRDNSCYPGHHCCFSEETSALTSSHRLPVN